MSTDISFKVDDKKFNYRVCGIIVRNGRILAKYNERLSHYALPGGRVQLGERAEDAIVRELNEELGIEAKIVRPLWLNQNFFSAEADRTDCHELCIYFLMDVSDNELPFKEDKFVLYEGGRRHMFEWLTFERLGGEHFYPIFLKKEIFNLPEQFTLRTENE